MSSGTRACMVMLRGQDHVPEKVRRHNLAMQSSARWDRATETVRQHCELNFVSSGNGLLINNMFMV